MKATELAKVLTDAAAQQGDFDVECRNVAGDYNEVEGVYLQSNWRGIGTFYVTTDMDEGEE